MYILRQKKKGDTFYMVFLTERNPYYDYLLLLSFPLNECLALIIKTNNNNSNLFICLPGTVFDLFS
jgi:hypothetical protein